MSAMGGRIIPCDDVRRLDAFTVVHGRNPVGGVYAPLLQGEVMTRAHQALGKQSRGSIAAGRCTCGPSACRPAGHHLDRSQSTGWPGKATCILFWCCPPAASMPGPRWPSVCLWQRLTTTRTNRLRLPLAWLPGARQARPAMCFVTSRDAVHRAMSRICCQADAGSRCESPNTRPGPRA